MVAPGRQVMTTPGEIILFSWLLSLFIVVFSIVGLVLRVVDIGHGHRREHALVSRTVHVLMGTALLATASAALLDMDGRTIMAVVAMVLRGAALAGVLTLSIYEVKHIRET